ncbi:MAG: amidohydrolase/deacetylase family metallohydrolase [Defluviitaleaceae bacterium]|nr:amidohydrolase/deacetylase family metallohydrolase [Defluviitaleaceae bacterium]
MRKNDKSLIIKNAKVVGNQSLKEKLVNILILNGIISKIYPSNENIFDTENYKIIYRTLPSLDLKGTSYISSGWIDAHVHCFEEIELYFEIPDIIGVNSGVTTIVDAGSTGADNIGIFYEKIKNIKTNVYSLLNISKTGIIAQNELSNLNNINIDIAVETANKYSNFIIGYKARMSKTVVGENGIIPLLMAKEIQKNKYLPIMCHIGSFPPSLEEITEILEKDDIITHCFNGKQNGILDNKTMMIKSCATRAYEKGVLFDVGHGKDSFNFNVSKVAKNNGIINFTISTDIYNKNRVNGPVYNLATTMEKFLYLGYSLEEVISSVTIKPALALKLKNKGLIKEGFDADLTIFNIENVSENCAKILIDSNGNKVKTTKLIKPIMTVVRGNYYECQLL